MLRCVAVCCSVLQYVAVFPKRAQAIQEPCKTGKRSVLQCVAVCCSALQCVAVCCSVLQCAAVCCSVLQCVAVCCSVLQYVAVCYSVLQCAAVCCSILQSFQNVPKESSHPRALQNRVRFQMSPIKRQLFLRFATNLGVINLKYL